MFDEQQRRGCPQLGQFIAEQARIHVQRHGHQSTSQPYLTLVARTLAARWGARGARAALGILATLLPRIQTGEERMQPKLNAAIFELTAETFVMSHCHRERERLRSLGEDEALRELDEVARRIHNRILELQATVEKAARDEGGDDEFNRSVNALLSDRRLLIDTSSKENLCALAVDLGVSAQVTPSSLREVCSGGDDPSLLDSIGRFLLLLAVSTLVAAGVGAPLAAAATHQAIGSKMLEDAIATFCGVGITEGAMAYHDLEKRRAIRDSTRSRMPTPAVPPTRPMISSEEILDRLRQDRGRREYQRRLEEAREEERRRERERERQRQKRQDPEPPHRSFPSGMGF